MRCDEPWFCVVDPAQHLPIACIQERLRPVAQINSFKKNMHSLKHEIDAHTTTYVLPSALSCTMSAHCLHTGTACMGRLCRCGLPQAKQASRTKSFESAVTWLHSDAAHYVPPCTPAAVWTRSMRRPLGGAASACPAHALFPLFAGSYTVRRTTSIALFISRCILVPSTLISL